MWSNSILQPSREASTEELNRTEKYILSKQLLQQFELYFFIRKYVY